MAKTNFFKNGVPTCYFNEVNIFTNKNWAFLISVRHPHSFIHIFLRFSMFFIVFSGTLWSGKLGKKESDIDQGNIYINIFYIKQKLTLNRKFPQFSPQSFFPTIFITQLLSISLKVPKKNEDVNTCVIRAQCI